MAVLEIDLSSNVVKINNYNLEIKEYKNQRVVTFEDIDKVHERIEGTAKRNFTTNRDRFIENIDYFEFSTKNVPTLKEYGFSRLHQVEF